MLWPTFVSGKLSLDSNGRWSMKGGPSTELYVRRGISKSPRYNPSKEYHPMETSPKLLAGAFGKAACNLSIPRGGWPLGPPRYTNQIPGGPYLGSYGGNRLGIQGYSNDPRVEVIYPRRSAYPYFPGYNTPGLDYTGSFPVSKGPFLPGSVQEVITISQPAETVMIESLPAGLAQSPLPGITLATPSTTPPPKSRSPSHRRQSPPLVSHSTCSSRAPKLTSSRSSGDEHASLRGPSKPLMRRSRPASTHSNYRPPSVETDDEDDEEPKGCGGCACSKSNAKHKKRSSKAAESDFIIEEIVDDAGNVSLAGYESEEKEDKHRRDKKEKKRGRRVKRRLTDDEKRTRRSSGLPSDSSSSSSPSPSPSPRKSASHRAHSAPERPSPTTPRKDRHLRPRSTSPPWSFDAKIDLADGLVHAEMSGPATRPTAAFKKAMQFYNDRTRYGKPLDAYRFGQYSDGESEESELDARRSIARKAFYESYSKSSSKRRSWF